MEGRGFATPMLLVIDVGNTTITIGLFEGEELRATWRIATDRQRLADEYAVMLLGLLDVEGIKPSEIRLIIPNFSKILGRSPSIFNLSLFALDILLPCLNPNNVFHFALFLVVFIN